jgi:hypothetical protein
MNTSTAAKRKAAMANNYYNIMATAGATSPYLNEIEQVCPPCGLYIADHHHHHHHHHYICESRKHAHKGIWDFHMDTAAHRRH